MDTNFTDTNSTNGNELTQINSDGFFELKGILYDYSLIFYRGGAEIYYNT